MKILRKVGLAVAALAIIATCCAFNGCAMFGAPNMPTPNNAQTAVYEARAELGINEFMLNKYYLRTADCSSPITTLPCKNFGIATSIQTGIKYAHDTVAAADNAVNDPQFNASTAGALIASMNAAVNLLQGWRTNPAVAATAPKALAAAPSAADLAEAKAATGAPKH